MLHTQIFISYRRDDAAGYARAVCDELARRFGADSVFMDVDDIDAGLPFADVIERAMGESKVLLVLIGRRWFGEREGAPRRIDEPGDLVAREVAIALAKGMRVIPVLLDDTPMPAEAQLPLALKPLAGRNALELGNARFPTDIEHLVETLREALAVPVVPAAAAQPRLTSARVAGGALLAIAALLGAWQWLTRGGVVAPAGSPAASAVPSAAASVERPAINGAWQAEVVYDWPNARFVERFDFAGDGNGVHGSASFLGAPRGVLEGELKAGELRFVTRTKEMHGGDDAIHRYRARLVGNELRVVMQTEGGSSSHVPVEFVARRVVTEPASSASR